ncbi:hypothetical protein Barb6_03102 [Bacteroidales bacterium Barb6]|nr:hypothetical protein Barb6_03102 [Bacteroidales bacterium Barb6]
MNGAKPHDAFSVILFNLIGLYLYLWRVYAQTSRSCCLMSLAEEVVQLLTTKNLTLATCESVTGGMIGAQIVGVSHASKVYRGGLVTYSDDSKIKLASINRRTIDTFGAISTQTAKEMAEGTIKQLRTDIAISITGNAGPIANENKPIGLAYVAITVIDRTYVNELISHEKTRNEIRIDFTFQALSLLLKAIKGLKA